MRITRSSKEAASLITAKITANKGCDRCPCCGETKTYEDYLRSGVFEKGVLTGYNKTWAKGIFNIKCDCYKCCSCGAEWESEPYQWN